MSAAIGALHRLTLPEAAPADIEIFRLDVAGAAFDADRAVLSHDERERAARFRREDDRIRAVATRAALRRLVGERLGRAPDELRFHEGRYGKPLLSGEDGLEFNVSHAGSFALIALSRRRALGVDIERCDETIDVAGLASLVSSPDERSAGDADRDAFFRRWVAKEAILKALGLGVAEQLQALSVWRRGAEATYELRHAREDWSFIGACALDAPPNYAAALAWVDHDARNAATSASGSTSGSEQVAPRQT